MEAERYLRKSADLGHEWAMLVLAFKYEKSNPEKSMDLYLQVARKDNCHAQKRLATIYFEGKIVPQNLCKSYFWALLASTGGFNRRSEFHHLASDPLSFSTSNNCSPLVPEKYKVEKELSPNYVQIVQDKASRWQKGQADPNFPLVQAKQEEKPIVSQITPPVKREIVPPEDKRKEKPIISKIMPLKPLNLPKRIDVYKSYKWIPCNIKLNGEFKANLSPERIFNLVNASVYTVIAASNIENLKNMRNISFASAVAISEKNLLTNFHVIENRPYVVIKHGERFTKGTVISGDKKTDRCIINVENETLSPVKTFRKYDSLNVGETVYSVGSPKGLENTLGVGIISGKRKARNLNFIQTTAQISAGSSGGGLFDSFGNLIGITTFKIKESEGLNFALSIEEFTR